MKKTSIFLFISALCLSLFPFSGDGASQRYRVGDRGPAGGVIVYDKGQYTSGWRYLEAAPEDQSPSVMWRDVPFLYVGGTGSAIGTGRANTLKIIKVQGTGSYAAMLCSEYRGGGRKDWFLPSKKELTVMRSVLAARGGGVLSGRYYWSSTEVDGSLSWRIDAESGELFADGKDCTACVRAVRQF